MNPVTTPKPLEAHKAWLCQSSVSPAIRLSVLDDDSKPKAHVLARFEAQKRVKAMFHMDYDRTLAILP